MALTKVRVGGVDLTTTDNSDNLTLTSTDADANAGPNLRMYRNSASPADVDRLGHITFDGRNDNSQDFTAAQIQVFTEDASDGTEDSSVTFTCINAGSSNNAMQINPTETTFNESSVDRDFRVESNNNTHALFVNAGDGNVQFFTTDGNPGNNTSGVGSIVNNEGKFINAVNQSECMVLNRMGNDGTVLLIRQAGNSEGSIAVSGSTVSFDGFVGRHESSGIPTNTPKGTVLSTIDDLDVYVDGNKKGEARADHAKVKISDAVGDSSVYGVVDTYTDDDKVMVASVGIGSVRVTGACAKGDLLESNGDGTAKVQSDDIVRSKTIGKVTIGNSNTDVKLVYCVLYCG